MVDTHAHLAMCEPPDAELVAAAKAVGVERILTVGIDEATNRAAIEAARAHAEVRACVGRHPNAAAGLDEEGIERIAEMAADEAVAAVGETGLDFFRKGASREEQEHAFRAQIEISRAVAKPLVIHVRSGQGAGDDAIGPCLDLLEAEAADVDVVLHCFSGSAEDARRAGANGWYCSFAGNVTYPKAQALREAAAVVPEELVLVETDSPFLSPQPVRRERNRPANVVHTAACVAEARGQALADLDRQVTLNAERLLGW